MSPLSYTPDEYLPDPDLIRAELIEELRLENSATRFRWRIGRRGAFLVLMGTAYIFLGYGYGYIDVPDATVSQLGLPLMIAEAVGINDGLRFWGTLWILAGVASVFNAWWPPGRDAFGFMALEGFALMWATLNIVGDVLLDAQRGWVVGVIFAAWAASVLIVSGMSDPTPLAKKAREVVNESKRLRGED